MKGGFGRRIASPHRSPFLEAGKFPRLFAQLSPLFHPSTYSVSLSPPLITVPSSMGTLDGAFPPFTTGRTEGAVIRETSSQIRAPTRRGWRGVAQALNLSEETFSRPSRWKRRFMHPRLTIRWLEAFRCA